MQIDFSKTPINTVDLAQSSEREFNVMAEAKKPDSVGQDISQSNIYNVSQGILENVRVSRDIRMGDITQSIISRDDNHIVIDAEIANLLDWLAAQQGITREIALKKAVATAAYVYDITVNQGNKLLVQRRDNSVGEIVLK